MFQWLYCYSTFVPIEEWKNWNLRTHMIVMSMWNLLYVEQPGLYEIVDALLIVAW